MTQSLDINLLLQAEIRVEWYLYKKLLQIVPSNMSVKHIKWVKN